MKEIIVVSDTHGADQNLRKIVRKEKNAYAMFFLGDGEADLRVVEEENPRLPVYAVRGNCDFGSFLPLDGLTAFDDVLFYYTHGHIYNAKFSLDDLAQAGRSRGADVVLFGHTHQGIMRRCGDVTLFNPGSAGRSYSGYDGYGVIKLGGGGSIEFEHRMVPEL